MYLLQNFHNFWGEKYNVNSYQGILIGLTSYYLKRQKCDIRKFYYIDNCMV